MTRSTFRLVFVPAITFALAIGAGGCSRPLEPGKETAPAVPAAPAATPAPPPAEEPKFEPAYPAEVSAEGLSDKDTEQQARPHRHDGGEEHTHGEKEKEGDHGHPH